MTAIAFQIMKYYRNFFSQLKINITVPMSRTSIFLFYMIIISCFIITCSKQFVTYAAFVTWLKSFFIFYSHDKIFIEMIFYHIFTIILLFKNCFNKYIDCIFTSVKNSWFAKSIINTYNFVSKPARNMFLILFSIWSIIISIITVNSF